jgi:hypothetical protein
MYFDVAFWVVTPCKSVCHIMHPLIRETWVKNQNTIGFIISFFMDLIISFIASSFPALLSDFQVYYQLYYQLYLNYIIILLSAYKFNNGNDWQLNCHIINLIITFIISFIIKFNINLFSSGLSTFQLYYQVYYKF